MLSASKNGCSRKIYVHSAELKDWSLREVNFVLFCFFRLSKKDKRRVYYLEAFGWILYYQNVHIVF